MSLKDYAKSVEQSYAPKSGLRAYAAKLEGNSAPTPAPTPAPTYDAENRELDALASAMANTNKSVAERPSVAEDIDRANRKNNAEINRMLHPGTSAPAELIIESAQRRMMMYENDPTKSAEYDKAVADYNIGLQKSNSPNVLNIAKNTIVGGAKSSAASYVDASRAVYEGGQERRDVDNRNNLVDAEWAVAEAKRNYDYAVSTGDPREIEAAENVLNANTTKLKGYADVFGEGVYDKAIAEAYDVAGKMGTTDAKVLRGGMGQFVAGATSEVQKGATTETAKVADDISASAQESISKAKEGLGTIGQLLVDAGVAGTQMAGDAAMRLVNPALGTGALFARSFGSATQEARHNGADIAHQMGYGAAVGLLEMATEKIFGLGNAGAYGKGWFDNAVDNAIEKLVKSEAGRKALQIIAGGVQEGLEEGISGIVSPALESIYNNKNIFANYDEDTAGEIIYSAIVGAILGSAGASLSGGISRISTNETASPTETTPPSSPSPTPSPAAPVSPASPSVIATETENGTEVNTEPLNEDAKTPTPTRVKVTKRPKSATGDAFVDAIANGVAPQANVEAETEIAPPAEGGDGLGAANAGFASTPFNEWRDSTNVEHKMGEKAARYVGLPKQNLQGKNTTKVGQTIMETAAVPDRRVAQIENMYVRGELSYPPDTNAEQIARARREIISKGWQGALNEWNKKVGEGVADADTVALGATLLINSANSNMSDAQFADLVIDYAELGSRSASALQALRVLKMLTPEGKLYGIQRTVRKLNESLPKRRASKNDPNNIPVANWAEEAGDQLADSMLKADIKGANNKTVIDTIVSDIKSLIKQNTPAMQTKRQGRSAADKAIDYLDNNEFYEEVMQTVKTRLADAYGEATASKLFAEWYDKSVSSLFLGEYGKKGITLDPALISEYRNAPDDATRDEVIEKMQKNIASQIPSTLYDKWTALRYVNMLGNFKTQGRNVLGNLGSMGLYAVKNEIKTAVEVLANAVTGGKVGRTSSAFVSKEWIDAAKNDFASYEDEVLNGSKYNDKSFANSFERGVEKERTIFKNNGTWGTDEASGIAASLPVKAARKAADVVALGMEGYRRGTNWAMEKGDLIFSKHHYARALAGYLKANGVSVEAFESGNVDPALLDSARKYAIKEAQEATFRDDNAFSNWASGALRGKNTPKAIKAIGEGIAPFRKTPANVFVRAVEYSPLGILDTAHKAAVAAKGNGDVTASDVINSLSKTLTGTGLFVLGAILRNKGLLRGGIDEDDREISEMRGEQEYSLVIPGVGSYTLDWLAPASITLFTGANLADVLSDNDLTINDIWDVATSLTEPMLTMSMMSGIDDALGSVKYSDSDLLQLAITSALGYVTQGLTNTMLGQFERTFEPERMTTYADKDSIIPGFLQKTVGKATAKMPGVDYNQTAYLDNFGNTESNGDVFERIVTNFISPGYAKETSKDPFVEALTEIHYATGEDPYPDGKAPNSYTIDGKKYTLNQNDKERYIKTVGDTYTEYANVILASDASIERKGEILSAIDEYATAIAKKEYYAKIGKEYKLSGTAKMVQNAVDTGMDLGRWFKARAQYDIIYDKDIKPSEKVKEFDKWLNTQDFTLDEKKAIRSTMSYYWQINARK